MKNQKTARQATSGEIIIVEQASIIQYVSDSVQGNIGYRINSQTGRPEVSQTLIDQINCEVALNEIDEAQDMEHNWPQVLDSY